MNGEKAAKPASLDRKEPEYAYVNVKAPPAEWPSKNTGGRVGCDSLHASLAVMISSRSAKISAVPPVRPQCFFSNDDFPQPLEPVVSDLF